MSLDNITMVGPVYPYKGGIAHYTGLMYKCLCDDYNVSLVSYKVQYPKLLMRKPQTDFDNDTFKIDDVEYEINTANPASWRKSAANINAKRPDLVIFQWWHPYFAPCYSSMVSHIDNAKILFVCHNVFPHERFPMDKQLTRMTLKRGDTFIVHSQQDADDLLTIKPSAVYKKAVLPTYNAFKFTGMDRAEARALTGVSGDDELLLFFGFVREYKGLRYLIAAMPEIVKRRPNARLMIVGDFGKKREEYEQLIAATGVKERIDVYGGYMPDKEVEKFFAASDLAVLPYVTATQSAVVQIAYGFDLPVVATNVGGLPEVVLDGKTGYVVPPENPGAIAGAVCKFFEEDKAAEFEANVKAEAYRYEWARMRETIEQLYNR